jgi:sec-independent protein translocase protein TatC
MSGPAQNPMIVAKAASGDSNVAPERMHFLDHLGELRKRLIWSSVTLVAFSAVAFHYAPLLFDLLRMPLAAVPSGKMIVLGPLEMFITYIKLALMVGLMASSPVILTQLWLFVAPGLYPSERRWVIPFVLAGSGSFVGGAAFCFYLVLPASFRYLIDMVPLTVEAHYSVSLYFSLVIQLMLAFGVVFELPLIMTLLGASGVVDAAAYRGFRKYWIVLAFVIGGVLTPTPDPMTQSMMALPLILFFELGIVGTQMVQKRKRAGR